MRIHTGDKPFTCHMCSKSFARASSLARHLNTHRHDQALACDTRIIAKVSFNQIASVEFFTLNRVTIQQNKTSFPPIWTWKMCASAFWNLNDARIAMIHSHLNYWSSTKFSIRIPARAGYLLLQALLQNNPVFLKLYRQTRGTDCCSGGLWKSKRCRVSSKDARMFITWRRICSLTSSKRSGHRWPPYSKA